MFKFASTLVNFLEKEKALFSELFSEVKLQHLQKDFYDKLLNKFLKDHKDKIIQEFIYGVGLET